MEPTEKRKFFRLHYKVNSLMPSFASTTGEYKVPEVSEQGIRMIVRNVHDFGIEQPVQGTLKLHTGSVNIRGKVLRILGNEVVLLLSVKDGLTFKQMLDEQRYLRNTHPTVFPRSKSSTWYETNNEQSDDQHSEAIAS